MVLASICLVSAKYADTYVLLLIGRFLIGVNSGINAGIAPMYLSEISPVALRGAVSLQISTMNIYNNNSNNNYYETLTTFFIFLQVGTIYQLVITLSILLSQILGMDSILGNENGWPWLLGLTLLPGILQVRDRPTNILCDSKKMSRSSAEHGAVSHEEALGTA